jgi:hypothetical protein
MQRSCKYAFATIEEAVFSVGFASRLYNEDLTQLQLEIGRVLDMRVEGDWEESAKKALCVLQLQWDWYNNCVEIRCQDTTSEDWEP